MQHSRNQLVVRGIVLRRTDFKEADRILSILTPDQGKLSVIAKGVRRPRSKLAGGIELLSVSDLTILPGRGELGTLISSRLITHFGNIVQDIQRTMLAYDFLKRMNRLTEDAAEEEYFLILERTLAGLNDLALTSEATELWFTMQLLSVTGHLPNLKTDEQGNNLSADEHYIFDYDHMGFTPHSAGQFAANHIKLLRLAYAVDSPILLKQVSDTSEVLPPVLQLAKELLQTQVHI